MANCPNCGSPHIQDRRESNINWGRAVAGWALFGIVGGAVGGVTGDDRHVNVCLDCGTNWKASDLYKSRQVLKSYTGIVLDLSEEKDRACLDEFMQIMEKFIDNLQEAKENSEQIIKDVELLLGFTGFGVIIGMIFAITGLFTSGLGSFIFGLFLTLVFGLIGLEIDKKLGIEKKRISIKKKAEKEGKALVEIANKKRDSSLQSLRDRAVINKNGRLINFSKKE